MSGLTSSISIRAKLITAFALLLAGTIGLGVFAVGRLDGVNAFAANLRDNWLPATRTLAEMTRAAERFRLNQAMLVDDTESERPARAKLIKEQAEVFRVAFGKYQPTIDLDAPDIIAEERGLARDIDRTWAAYLAASAKFEDLISHNRRDEAVAFENNEMKTGMDALRQALNADLDFQVREGNKAGDRGAAFGESAHTWIMISVGAMAALCLGAGWFVDTWHLRPDRPVDRHDAKPG
jgi:methyl-accepting chemotaxis protein